MLNKDQAMSLARTVLKVGGAMLVAHGATKAASALQLVSVEDLSGLIMMLAGIFTSLISHKTPVSAPDQPSSASLPPGSLGMTKAFAAIAMLGFGAHCFAQTDTNNPLNGLLGTPFPSSLTNINLTLGGDYIKSTKQVGEFALLSYNLPLGDRVGAGLGIGLDNFGHQTYSVSGNVSLKVDVYALSFLGTNNAFTKALSSQLFTPGVFAGMGTPFGGGQSTQLETIEATFVSWHPKFTLLGAIPNITPIFGTRQNAGAASGQFFGGSAGLTWMW